MVDFDAVTRGAADVVDEEEDDDTVEDVGEESLLFFEGDIVSSLQETVVVVEEEGKVKDNDGRTGILSTELLAAAIPGLMSSGALEPFADRC